MTYKYFTERPDRLTAEFLQSECARLEERIAEAEASESSELWLRLYEDWNALKGYGMGEGSRISYAFARWMDDPTLEDAHRYYRTRLSPIMHEMSSRLVTALLHGRHRDAFLLRYGEFFITSLELSLASLAPVNSQLRVRIGELATDYSKVVASGEIIVRGESFTLGMAGSLLSSEDRELRREVYQAIREWYLERRDLFAGIFDEQVRLRDRMGHNLGYESFTPLAYIDMGRTDYGPEEARRFRESVRRYVVPLQRRLLERQREQLGTETLQPWDVGYDPILTLPRGVVPVESQLQRAGRLFSTLSPELAEHFHRMCSEELIDLENRKGKRSGAFCTYFPDEGRPAILCNSTGDSGDVRTLIHEMGHAFQKWESSWIDVLDMQWPTADVAEIHSTGLEYLSLPYITEFFSKEHAEKFRRSLWKGKVALICLTAVGDEFQHWIYEHPDASPDERDAMWSQIVDLYQPGIDYNGVEGYKALGWYLIAHFFQAPFYTIDYAIAATAAMQLALIDAVDHERAMAIYLELCRTGGTRSLLDVLATTGLRSPFEPELMRDLMVYAGRELGIAEDTMMG